MDIYIIIPSYNEEEYIASTLQSLVNQTYSIKKILVVNDNSTDNSQNIIDSFTEKHSFIESLYANSKAIHNPGSKVINAFQKGFDILNDDYDLICKLDADLIFPSNYFENIVQIFKNNPTCGMAGGFCYIEKKDSWVLENLTNKDHIRGALKTYRKECFKDIGGLKNTMGWDTVDELLTQYHGWKVITDESLHVKHLKPTGVNYSKEAKYKQGEAFYKMRYGFLLCFIASAKLAYSKKSLSFFSNTLAGFLKASRNNLDYIVSKKEGAFIRKLRWRGIKNKLFNNNN